jgi:hypothetical protein
MRMKYKLFTLKHPTTRKHLRKRRENSTIQIMENNTTRRISPK